MGQPFSFYFALVTIACLTAILYVENGTMAGSSALFWTTQYAKQCRSPSVASYLKQLPQNQLISDALEVADRIKLATRASHQIPTAVLFLSNSKYEPRFEEMINTWSHFVGRESIVMAALDKATETYFTGRGIKTVRVFPDQLSGEVSVREAVLRAKVETPSVFLLKGLRVIMVEMDIYCRFNPLHLDNGTADVLVSEHNYADEVNVGFWIAYPTCPVVHSFRRMQVWATSANRTHAYCDGAFDQKLMHYAWLGHGALSAGSNSRCRDFSQRDQVFNPQTDEPVALQRISYKDIMHWPLLHRPDPETWPGNTSDPLCVHIWSGFGSPAAQMRYGYHRKWVPVSSARDATSALERLDALENGNIL